MVSNDSNEREPADESERSNESGAANRISVLKKVLERMASEASADPLRLAVIVEGLAVLESQNGRNSDHGDEALVRAVGLVMRSSTQEALVAAASRKSGHDVKADMNAIRGALEHAILMIAWHGDEEGARYAKVLFRRVVKIANEYQQRANVTFGESVIGALRSLSHASFADGRSKLFPNYNLIARAVLRNKSAQPNFEEQVTALEKVLPEQLAPYVCDRGYRSGVDLREVARVALKAGGVDPYNVFDAPTKMRATRLQDKLGEKAPPKRRQPRAPKRKA